MDGDALAGTAAWMTCWTDSAEAAALLASCAARPPRRRIFLYRFQETLTRFVGRRVGALRRLYRSAEPPLDTLAWREWLARDPQTILEAAIRGRSESRIPTSRGDRKMRSAPIDSLARHSRLIAALCEDLASPDYLRTGRTPRADAQCRLGRDDRTLPRN